MNSSVLHLINAGYMVTGHGKKVIIDGVYGRAPSGFSALPDEMREAILEGKPPFDEVTHVLISHYHKDHFDTSSLLTFLEHNSPEIYLPDEERRYRRLGERAYIAAASSEEGGVAGQSGHSEPGQAVIHPVPQEEGRLSEFDLGGGDRLSAFVIRHSGRSFKGVSVIVYMLSLGSWTGLFLSDADFDPETIGEMTEGIRFDAVFANPLFLDIPGGRETLFEKLDTERIVIGHLPLPGDDVYGLRDKPEACIEAYGLPADRITILTGFGETL